ncbi:MAG: O-methyltransferase [Clostridia bacterium]|nr:O-methyltransferase [Clostridia bacterium]MDD4375409.1 O-methyltransferase [Clostridia bacterium]
MIDENKLEKLKKSAKLRNIPILQDDTMQVITEKLKEMEPKSILEIGTAVGYSALCFSKYLDKDGQITSIEINEDRVIEAVENIKEISSEDNIEVVHMDAYEYMKSQNKTYDIIFIDAAKGQYMKYLKEALRLTKKGSIIIADNILHKGLVMSSYNEHRHRTMVTRLREYIKEVTENTNLNTKIIEVGDGLAVSTVLN